MVKTQELLPTRHCDTFTRDNLPPAELWPEFLLDRPEVQYPECLNCAYELVDKNILEGRAHKIAIYGNEGLAWTYAELQDKVKQIALVLREQLGLQAGQRILLRGANSPMLAASFLGAIYAGLVVVPTMPLLRAVELKQVIDKAQITAVLCDEILSEEVKHCLNTQHPQYCSSLTQTLYFRSDQRDGLEARMDEVSQAARTFEAVTTSRDDVCLIAFTSGTTGLPKGTMHFHRDVLAMCDLFPRHILKMQSDEVVCGTPPLAFTFGLGGLLAFPLRYGAATVLLEKHTPESLLHTIAQYKATQCYTAPTFYRQMAQLVEKTPALFDTASLRHPVSAGEALPDATRELWKRVTGKELTDGIGGTEMIHIYIAAAGHEVKRGAIGKVVPGYIAQIVDDKMQAVPPGVVGRLAVKGPTGCRYLADERQKNYVQAGWNLPGDTFVMDEAGYFSYQARNDDMIVSAGYNIAGPEVESALLLHPAVAECGVIGVPDAERGQVVQAFVVLKPGHTADQDMVKVLQAHVKATIAPYKYPRYIQFLTSLPRTETGKLQRFRLRQLLEVGV